jgi:Condensation domain
MHLGSRPAGDRTPESEPFFQPHEPVDLDSGAQLHSASVEKSILAASPQISDCLVVSVRLRGRVQTDILLLLQPGVDPDGDHESVIRSVLTAEEAATLRRIFVIGADRELPKGDLEHRRTLLWQRQAAEIAGAALPGFGPDGGPVPEPTLRVPVEFAGDGAGTAELTWGQREIWQSMTRQGNWLPLGGSRPLDPGTSVEDVADELAYLHHRFPSMRTKLRFDADGRPGQELFASGTTHLEVFDVAEAADSADSAATAASPAITAADDALDSAVGNDADAAESLAAAIAADYQRRLYDLRAEWPVRMAVVRRGGVPTHMAVAMHHLALDGGGAEIMFRDVAVRADTPPVGLQQLEQTAWQASEAGRRHSDRTLRHFADILRVMPTPTFPASSDPWRPRYWSAVFESAALLRALAILGERTGGDPGRVLLGVYGVALARVTGVHPVIVRPVVGNRFRRQLADVVCHAAQAGILLLDVADATVEEVIERAGPAALSAFKHGYFNP